MTDISQVKVMSAVAQLDASQAINEQRKLTESNKALAASEAQVQGSVERSTQAISVSERALQARAIRLGGVSKASALLARAEEDLAKTEQLVAAAIAQGAAPEARLTQLRADAVRNVNEKRAALERAAEVEKVAALQATVHAAAVGKVTSAYQAQLATATQLQQRTSSFGIGTGDSVKAAYQASIAPIDMQTAAVRRNYETSLQAGQAQAAELAGRLKVKQAYEASLNPTTSLTSATKGHADVMKLSAFQAQNLTYQLNDVVVSLASGQRPLTVLMQQGSQITPIFGGIGNTFRAAGAAVMSIGAPILAAAGTFTVLAGAMLIGLKRAADLDAQLRTLRTTLAATGGATGISAADLQSATLDFARQPGVSRDTATQAAQGLASNPLLNADLLRRALPTVRDFAAATGKEIPDAAKAMAAALTGGYSAAKQLDQQFQLFEPHQLNAIRNFEEQDLKGQAANIVLAAMQEKWKGLADGGLTDAAKAANNFGNAWDKLLDGLSKTWVIKGARQALIDLTNIAGGASTPTSAATGAGLRASGPIGQGILAFVSALGLAGGPATATPDNTAAGSLVGSLSGGFAAIARAADPATAAIDRFNAAAAGGKGALHNMAIQANEAATALDPAGREMERLANEQVKLTTAMANGQITAEAYAKAMAMLGIAMSQVQTPENLLADLDKQLSRARLGPAAGAGADAADRIRLAGGTQAQQDEARRKGAAIYGAGQGSGLAEQLAAMRAGSSGAAAVIAAYAQSTEAGRRAELQLKALEAQYKNGTAAVAAYAAELIKQDEAQRRIEGARDLAKLKDDIADAEKLNDALAKGTLEYERQRIAIEAATKVRQGYLTPQQGSQYEAALLAQRQAGMVSDAITMSRRADPQAQLADDIARLDALKKLGLSEAAYALAVRDANDAMRDQKDRIAEMQSGFGAIADGVASAAYAYRRANSDFRTGQEIFTSSVQLMSDALSNFVKTGKLNFASLLASFSDMLIQMGLRAAASQVFGWIGGLFKGGSSGDSHSGGSSGGGGLFSGIVSAIGSLLGFAEGGRPPVGRASIVGERGPEWFVPDQPGTIFNQQQLAGMAANSNGGGNVTINQYPVFGAGVNGMKREEILALMVQMKNAAVAEVYDRKRRGGSYASAFS